MKDTVFIHTNDRQMLGALVSSWSLQRNSTRSDAFEVRVIRQEDYPFFRAREGQLFLRGNERRPWRNDDLQSFTPLRFMPPELMAYQGRAVVIDPDVFAVGDITELLDRDKEGKALMCRARYGHNGNETYLASSVMLLDCARLRHWHVETQFGELFDFKRDYEQWIALGYEPRETVGLFGEEWNHFDTLDARTRLLHNTKRRTQPWKTGLPVDYTIRQRPAGVLKRLGRLVLGNRTGTYQAHPDRNQERFFFGLLRECLERGIVTEAMVREEMRLNHVRHDALDLVHSSRAAA